MSAGMATPVTTAGSLPGYLVVGNTIGLLLALLLRGGVGREDWGRA